MAILNKGTTYASGDNVTAANINALVDSATFKTGSNEATDNSTLQVHSDGYLMVKDGGISSSKLAAGAVDATSIGSGVITSTQLATNSVTSSQIASSAVTSAKIADSAVSTAKIADDAITAAKISDSDSLFSVNDSTNAIGIGGNVTISKDSSGTENNITVTNLNGSPGESRLVFSSPNASISSCIFGFQPNPGQISITISDGSGGFKSMAFNSVGKLSVPGDLGVIGALSKGSGSFKIDHPLKPESHHLVHSFLEGPQADLLYRGKVDLVNGSALVDIDSSAGMSDGTFVRLCANVQCFTSNESSFSSVKGTVANNKLTIESEDSNSTDTISWMVVGERQDDHMKETDWTDSDGKVIVEPAK